MRSVFSISPTTRQTFRQLWSQGLLSGVWRGLSRFHARHGDRLLSLPVEVVDKRTGDFIHKDEVGRLGEKIAARWARWELGMKILACNYRAPRGGEIDIVARDGEVLVFIEVKTRTSTAYGRAASAVDWKKRRYIFRGSRYWKSQLAEGVNPIFRFDIAEVYLTDGEKPRVNWIRAAFKEAR